MGHAAGNADRRADTREVTRARCPGPWRAVALACSATIAAGPAAAQTWRTVTSARQLHGERALAVTVQYGVGRFRLGPAASGQLYRMELRYDEERFSPIRDYDPTAPSLRLGVRGREGTRVAFNPRRNDQAGSLDLGLTPDVPLALALDLGAVEAEIELGGLAIRRATYRTGASQTRLRWSRTNPIACEELSLIAGAAEFAAVELGNSNCARVRFEGGLGEVTLDFSGAWRNSMTADITVGVGALHLRLPRDVGVAVTVNRFLASFDAAGFVKRGDTYFSSNYDTSRKRLTLTVTTSLGGIDVAWVN